VPTYFSGLQLKEVLKSDGEVADITLDLGLNECKAVYFTQNSTAVLICNIGGNIYRLSAKPVPKSTAGKYIA